MKISNNELIRTFLKTSILSSFDNSYHDKCCELMVELLSRLQMVEDLKKAYQDMGVERDVALVAYENLKKYKLFFESCSCLFAEGVEFMTKTEIYESIKKEVKKLEGEP